MINKIIDIIKSSKLFQRYCIINSQEVLYSNFSPNIENYLLKLIKLQKDIKINQYFILSLPKFSLEFIFYRINNQLYFIANTKKVDAKHIELLNKINKHILEHSIKCILISTANIYGPTPQFSYPDQDEEFLNIVAMKSLILLAGNQDQRALTTSIIPISKDFGYVYLFYINHPKGRAGIFDAAITIVVENEVHDWLINSMDSITNIIKNYLKFNKIQVNEEGNIVYLEKPLEKLMEMIRNELLHYSMPVQVSIKGDPHHDIEELKKSITELREMLGK
ncbi:MAG: hypothetical protein ACTSPQ_17605 [Candidatus Helarchaeota archaeon]